jgi:hypothetical protein
MGCEPALRVDVANIATPLASSGDEPSVESPSLNATLPVGVPEPDEVTVAVNITD